MLQLRMKKPDKAGGKTYQSIYPPRRVRSWGILCDEIKNSSGTKCSTTVLRKHTVYCLQCISTLGESLYEVLEQPSASGPPGVRTATSIAAKKRPKKPPAALSNSASDNSRSVFIPCTFRLFEFVVGVTFTPS
jgi:hypothetical protein